MEARRSPTVGGVWGTRIRAIALVAGCGRLSGAGDPADRYKVDCEIVSAVIDDSLAGFTDAVATK